MRVVFDYRPALRARSGVGEYLHQTASAFAARYPADALTLFTSSWRDRPSTDLPAQVRGAVISDHRVPVSVLNAAWHWLEWPAVESLTGASHDVAYSPHPLLLPSRAAAQVVTMHDLDFLSHPERTEREIRRDYPRLVRRHAHRAARIVVPSEYARSQVIDRLEVPPRRVEICPPGLPEWASPPAGAAGDGYILFMGTLEARKNVGGLLEAYGRLLARRPDAPTLVLAGHAGPDAQPWLDTIARPPLAGRVEHIGYVASGDRQRVYSGARFFVLPSLEEGFGLPALEAMSLGIPVVVSRRGALPEVVGDAGVIVEPDDPESIAAAMDRLLSDEGSARTMAERGRERARPFEWRRTAEAIHGVFERAIADRGAAG